jgi:molybdenum cofactor guanylyltransferase
MIARVIERLQEVCTETIIVANDIDTYQRFGLRIVADIIPGKGSLGGIFSGLQMAREQHALAVACDMPFLNVPLLRHMISYAPQYDVVVPRARDPLSVPDSIDKPVDSAANLQPLHAIYSKACLGVMQDRIAAGDLQIVRLYDEVRVHIIEPSEVERFDSMRYSFLNVNTPGEWASAKSIAEPGA